MVKIICMEILILMTVFCAVPAEAADGAKDSGRHRTDYGNRLILKIRRCLC